MRVVVLSETFSKNMGYATNALPKALARLGHDVHLVTLNLPPYFYQPDFEKTYGAFLQKPGALPPTEKVDGYTVHYMRHQRTLGYMRMPDLKDKLRSLRPDVVQTLATIGWIPLHVAVLKLSLGYPVFTETHTHASVFPLAQQNPALWDYARIKNLLTRTVCGRIVSLITSKCYATAPDCGEIAVRFFGIQPEKVDICPLGVDTELFSPAIDAASIRARTELRSELDFTPTDIVCIYTGRFSNEKNPLVLAQAIQILRDKGESFRGLFLGDGIQKEAISNIAGCVIRPFAPFNSLAKFYRAADIGVWPTQESMSMLDGAACGLPIVVNDTVQVLERITGNGISYRLNDAEDLARALYSLRDQGERRRLGAVGADKMAREFSWDIVAARRLADYTAALGSPKSAATPG